MPEGAGVKETLCTICEHKDVCAYKMDYLNILKAVGNACVYEVKETPDGERIKIERFFKESKNDFVEIDRQEYEQRTKHDSEIAL